MGTYRKSINSQNIQTSSYTKAEAEERKQIEKELNGECDDFEMPIFLDGNEVAIDEFIRLSNELRKMGVLSNVDNVQLGMYCQLYSTYLECVKQENEKGLFLEYTNKGGETNLVEAPWVKLKRATETQMITLGKQFGLTPVDRLKFIGMKKEEKNDDPLMDLLKND